MKTGPLPFIGRYRRGWMIFWMLVILLINALAVGLAEAIRGLSHIWLVPLGITAFIIGWTVGGAHKGRSLLFAIGFVSGSFFLVMASSGAATNLFRALSEALFLILRYSPSQYNITGIGPLFYYLYLTASNLMSYLSETAVWLYEFVQSSARYNPMISALIWRTISWNVLFSTGWLYRNKVHAFVASLPVLGLLSGVLGYSRQNTSGLLLILASILALMVLFEQLKREHHWKNQQIDYSEEIRFDITSLAIPVILFIIFITWLVPHISIESIRDLWRDSFQVSKESTQEFAHPLGIEQEPIDQLATFLQGGMPQNHLIGSGPELSDILIMEIDTGETFLPPQVEPDTIIPKYYWFGRSYDIYSGLGWETSRIIKKTIQAGEAIVPAESPFTRLVSQVVYKTENASAAVYALGIPQTINQPIIASWREPVGDYFAAQVDAQEYQVEAPVLDISEEIMRQANSLPPAEILDVYLQLPEEIPDRVFELAVSLISEEDTPYEKAESIETYLRNFEYTLDLPQPPDDRDIVDYFLFDLQRGYCDYYASAMVILARISGLPSRLAVGYATGRYDYTQGKFIVTEANAHAWPEVYIAPFGWIPFEPTASLTPFNWDLENRDVSEYTESDVDEETDRLESPLWLNLLGLGILLILILFAVFLWHWISHHHLQSKSTIYRLEKHHQQMKNFLKQRFVDPQLARTPLEYRDSYVKYLENQSAEGYHQSLINHIIKDLDFLTTLYHQGVYGPNPITNQQLARARDSWRSLRVKSWILRIASVFK